MHYVDEAAGRLLPRNNARLAKLIGLVGATLFGAAPSGTLGLVNQNKYSGVEVSVYFSLVVLGVIGGAYQILKE